MNDPLQQQARLPAGGARQADAERFSHHYTRTQTRAALVAEFTRRWPERPLVKPSRTPIAPLHPTLRRQEEARPPAQVAAMPALAQPPAWRSWRMLAEMSMAGMAGFMGGLVLFGAMLRASA